MDFKKINIPKQPRNAKFVGAASVTVIGSASSSASGGSSAPAVSPLRVEWQGAQQYPLADLTTSDNTIEG
jgi:hypothetical protein